MAKTMKLFIYLIVLLGSISAFAQSESPKYDTTQEKSDEFPEPSKHRIFFRSIGGAGSILVPESQEWAKEGIAGLLATGSGSFIRMGAADSGPSQKGLEYRYNDRFRVSYDTRTIKLKGTYQSGSALSGYSNGAVFGNVDWTENVTKIGVAYYHPFSKYFSAGGILRKYDIAQNYGVKEFSHYYLMTSAVTSAPANEIFNSNSQSKSFGLVPGIGIEIKPLRWFEIHCSYEKLNFTGTGSINSRGIISVYNLAGPLVENMSKKFNYTGAISNFALVFRYSSWFSTKWGYVAEQYSRSYNQYLIFNNFTSNPALNALIGNGLFSSLVNSNSYNRYIYLQIEFSKGFD